MDASRRSLVLGLPALASLGTLHGCGGAESNQSDTATAQPTSSEMSVAQATSGGTAGAFTIRNGNGGNFPVNGSTYDIAPQPKLIQAVVNAGLPGGVGPVLSINLSSTSTSTAGTKLGSLSLTVKLRSITPSAAVACDLSSGGALASEALIDARQLNPDGTVTTHAFRITSGILTVSQISKAKGTVSISLSDVVANAATGFGNAATGSISVAKSATLTLTAAFEDTGTQLT